VGESAVLIAAPLREVGEVVHDALRVSVEDVRPVTVHEDAVLVVLVVRITSDVGASVYQVDAPAGARKLLGNDAASVACAYHQNIGLHD